MAMHTGKDRAMPGLYYVEEVAFLELAPLSARQTAESVFWVAETVLSKEMILLYLSLLKLFVSVREVLFCEASTSLCL